MILSQAEKQSESTRKIVGLLPLHEKVATNGNNMLGLTLPAQEKGGTEDDIRDPDG